MIASGIREAAALPRIVGALETRGAPAGEWTRVQFDSREVGPGDLFVAIPGENIDGHAFIPGAMRRGALAAVVERFTPEAAWPEVRVRSARRALAILASEETDHPSHDLLVVGVTGTNGKTTTTHLIRAALKERGERVGLIGTVGYELNGEHEPALHTTPEAPDLARLFRRFADQGASAVVMEVSSHALAQDRTYGLAFDVGVFTNLTQDHLDFHGTMEAYRDAKSRLFRAETRGNRTKTMTGVLNMEDPAGRWIRVRADAPTLGYGDHEGSEITAEDVRLSPSGARLQIRHPRGVVPVALKLRGRFNVTNALAAFAAAYAAGTPPEAIALGLGSVDSVPGRLEPVDAGQPYQVLVDYAHTPDALERALEAVRAFGPKRLICVFGCGGDRDRGKRPLMGAAAARLADQVIITSDNPRSEDPAAIVAEIEAGAKDAKSVRTVIDRTGAIESAIDSAMAGDAILIAGKGHETYQIIGKETIPFDDRVVARNALRARGFSG
ncbi:MAG TPA: UDP-N-acetylmuramoyl-L-alanyl-D-glutamate--2,6-diaminopimelate ligase [Candidatus Limnocylindrales bacterium]|nr:UDP-N-acetylmuramoyl-L-alanyl-D-glutamate--2,6-diaminopimelate ligase [Candidatus Limnocylindrales bacterium]